MVTGGGVKCWGDMSESCAVPGEESTTQHNSPVAVELGSGGRHHTAALAISEMQFALISHSEDTEMLDYMPLDVWCRCG